MLNENRINKFGSFSPKYRLIDRLEMLLYNNIYFYQYWAVICSRRRVVEAVDATELLNLGNIRRLHIYRLRKQTNQPAPNHTRHLTFSPKMPPLPFFTPHSHTRTCLPASLAAGTRVHGADECGRQRCCRRRRGRRRQEGRAGPVAGRAQH